MRTSHSNFARLALDKISKTYGMKTVVNQLSLAVSPSKVTCLLGPSGCGKSTTLRIAAGVEKQDSGRVYLNDKLISSGETTHLEAEERGVGLIFQDFALFPHLSVHENVSFGIKERRNQAKLTKKLISKIGLSGFEEKYPHMLSGGEQQRVALARAMATSPDIMLMDEPFSGLDKRLRDEIRDETLSLMKEEGTAVLLVTHEPDEAMRMADNIILMRDGSVIQQGAPYNIYNKPIDAKAASFFSDVNILNGRVFQSRTETPFGPFITPGFEEGSMVEILIRPQHLKIDFDRNGRGPNPTAEDGVPARGLVARTRFMGKESIIELRMDADGAILTATIPGVFLPPLETPLWLSMRRDRCFVFLKS